MYLLGEHKAIPVMASARIHTWTITLSAVHNGPVARKAKEFN